MRALVYDENNLRLLSFYFHEKKEEKSLYYPKNNNARKIYSLFTSFISLLSTESFSSRQKNHRDGALTIVTSINMNEQYGELLHFVFV